MHIAGDVVLRDDKRPDESKSQQLRCYGARRQVLTNLKNKLGHADTNKKPMPRKKSQKRKAQNT